MEGGGGGGGLQIGGGATDERGRGQDISHMGLEVRERAGLQLNGFRGKRERAGLSATWVEG